jgi:hypothetical protein
VFATFDVDGTPTTVEMGVVIRGAGPVVGGFSLVNVSRGFLVLRTDAYDQYISPDLPISDEVRKQRLWAAITTDKPVPPVSANASRIEGGTVGDHLYWASLISYGNAMNYLRNVRNREVETNQAFVDLLDQANSLISILAPLNLSEELQDIRSDLISSNESIQSIVDSLAFSSTMTSLERPDTYEVLTFVEGYNIDWRFGTINTVGLELKNKMLALEAEINQLIEFADSISSETAEDESNDAIA